MKPLKEHALHGVVTWGCYMGLLHGVVAWGCYKDETTQRACTACFWKGRNVVTMDVDGVLQYTVKWVMVASHRQGTNSCPSVPVGKIGQPYSSAVVVAQCRGSS
eukprot:scaffold203716_cov27-Tisochrysis_lutea.AAC.1